VCQQTDDRQCVDRFFNFTIMKFENQINYQNYKTSPSSRTLLGLIVLFGLFLTLFFYLFPTVANKNSSSPKISESAVIFNEAVELPVKWGDLGQKMIAAGVIDDAKLEAIHLSRGEFGENEQKLLYEEENEKIVMTAQNAGFLLNLFWAFGLSNKNKILEQGPMTDPRYGGANRFASTAGWTLALGNPMNHYSRHNFVTFNLEQQALVEEVAKNIYRPCCGNSTYFPDCNHGMAMLGLLELLVANGISEEEMYKIALQVNGFWFPDVYQTIEKYLESRNLNWQEVDPKIILGNSFSSASGYARVLSEMRPIQSGGSGNCGI